MNAVKIYEDACRAADRSEITLGEFEKRIEPLKDVESVVRCKDCGNRECDGRAGTVVCGITGESHSRLWFCADGERR